MPSKNILQGSLVVAALVVSSFTPAAAVQNEAPGAQVSAVLFPTGNITSSAAGTKAFSDVDRTLLPVLIPRPFLSQNPTFVGEPLSYSASIKEPGVSASITGTRVTFVANGEAVPAPSRGMSAEHAEVGDNLATAGYVRFGVAYLVTVECDNPRNSKCTSPGYAKALLTSAEIVGGGRGSLEKVDPKLQPSPPKTPGGPPITGASALPPGWYQEPGDLLRGSGTGVKDKKVYAPGIRFPVELKPAYLNSQVYSPGGYLGGGGSSDSPVNYSYPWRDNFCEKRSRVTSMCPSGKGHQGQDIRPAKPNKPNDPTYWAVAVEDGKIQRISTWMVVLVGSSGIRYNYLHLNRQLLKVAVGQTVKMGDRIGYISNEFGGTPTTVHLHFEMMQNLPGRGLVNVPPYSSLVAAYAKM